MSEQKESKIVTYYNDVADELDSHFTRALSTGTRAAAGSQSSRPQSADMQSEGISSPPQEPLPSSESLPYPYHPPPTSPAQQQYFGSHMTKAKIIYPEFINYLVHPEVDSYQDLPKLPGEGDPSVPCPPHIQAWLIEIEAQEEADKREVTPEKFTEEELREILELEEQDM